MGKNGGDKNYVSLWFWMFALLVMALPCIGVIMILIWAFVGENESRKNYFRALIVWGLILTFFWVFIAALGLLPVMANQMQHWLHQISPKL
jgi:Na+/melibiose symporter-like transporter